MSNYLESYKKLRERNRIACKKYRLINKDKYEKSVIDWRLRNPEHQNYINKIISLRTHMKALGLPKEPIKVSLIQEVYEKNIKKYGTLTCYLCLKNVDFGKDTIDHVIPLVSGGLNTFDNLSIAHFKCNLIKGRKRLEDCDAFV